MCGVFCPVTVPQWALRRGSYTLEACHAGTQRACTKRPDSSGISLILTSELHTLCCCACHGYACFGCVDPSMFSSSLFLSHVVCTVRAGVPPLEPHPGSGGRCMRALPCVSNDNLCICTNFLNCHHPFRHRCATTGGVARRRRAEASRACAQQAAAQSLATTTNSTPGCAPHCEPPLFFVLLSGDFSPLNSRCSGASFSSAPGCA